MYRAMEKIKRRENIFEQLMRRKTKHILNKEPDKTMTNVKYKKEKKNRRMISMELLFIRITILRDFMENVLFVILFLLNFQP